MLSWIARGLLRLGGWTAVGDPPAVPKAVYIAAPHTSNWDGVWGVIYKVAKRIDINFFAKDSLFWFPLSLVVRGFGGVPLDRSKPGMAVPTAVAAFREHDRYFFGMAPEGTRSLRPGWKTGFYRIAREAGVPVVLGFFDYRNKRIGIGKTIELTGDVEADMQVIRQFYEDNAEGRWPGKASPVTFVDGMPPQAGEASGR
jgi:1-acyl-sn-glycerol-3-phosphate acyltransferase